MSLQYDSKKEGKLYASTWIQTPINVQLYTHIHNTHSNLLSLGPRSINLILNKT